LELLLAGILGKKLSKQLWTYIAGGINNNP